MKSEYIPIPQRWDSTKFRMWRLPSGYWIATQPLQVHGPMFANASTYASKAAHQFISRDRGRVLHELQLAIAKAAA